MPRQPNNHENNEGTPPRSIHIPISKDTELHKTNDARTPPDSTIETENTGANPQIPQQRMQTQLNPGLPSSQPGYIHPKPPQQNISYSQGYGNQPLLMGSQAVPNQRPPSTQGQVQQQYPKPKEKKHILNIVDPNTGKNITADILKSQSGTEVTTVSQDSGFRSTPVSTTEIPQQRMQTQFNPGIPSSQPGYIHPMPPQQNISYSQGYGNQPLFMGSQAVPNQQPPSTQGQVQQQYPKPKEKKHILNIVDHTGKDITADILKSQSGTEVTTVSQDSGSRSTPVSTTEIPQQRMQTQFNPGIPSSQPGYIHPMPPQQNISYSQGYGNQPLFMGSQAVPNQQPPSTQGQVQQQYPKPKEKKHILNIVDHTGKDITADILKSQSGTEVTTVSQDSGSRSTPVSTTEAQGLQRQPSNQENKSRLHKANVARKPSHKDSEKEPEEDDATIEELYRKTRSILDKLTPQTFQTLVSQMRSLPIDSESKLKCVIDVVFEKAISEPNFSATYANMCRCLSMFKVPSEKTPGEMVNFLAVILRRCQREFEKYKSPKTMFVTKGGEREITKDEEAERKVPVLQQGPENEKLKARSVGNIRFIGELFKSKLLTENIMHDCVFKLLRTKDPDNLECLCHLLTTIGKELDIDKAKPRMDQYFQLMGKIVREKKIPSRVRFMLQDVMDLRTNRWVPRRVANNPKTIDQIHKEVAKEAQEKALLSQQKQLQQRAQRGGRQTCSPGQMGDGGVDGVVGWNTVGANRTPLKSVDVPVDPFKMKLSKQNVASVGTSGGGAGRFSGWGRGSTGGTTERPFQEKEKPNTPSYRAIVATSAADDGGHSGRGQGHAETECQLPPVQSTSVVLKVLSEAEMEQKTKAVHDELFATRDITQNVDESNIQLGPGGGTGRFSGCGRGSTGGTTGRPSQEKEKPNTPANRAIGASQSVDGGHRERSRGRAEPERKPSPVQPASVDLKVLSEAEMEKKTKDILNEYFAIQNVREAILCVQELSTQNHHHFVYHAINHVLERSSQARKKTGHILHDLVNRKIISVDNYIKGLVEVLEYAEDLEIDIPKIWQYYGELISPMIQDNCVPLSFLQEAVKPLLANDKAGILLAEILHDASQRVNYFHTLSYEQHNKDVPSGVSGREYTNGGESASTTPTTGLPVKEIEVKLHELIVQDKADNETVFDWIESNIDDQTTKRPKFIRALMTAVCNSAIKGDKGKERLDLKELRTRNGLLQKYLDHQAESELQALFALQTLVTKLEHPKGLLHGMFDTLYDEDFISEDVFFQWEKSEDEPEGKNVCLKQTIKFFTWLREAEEDS